METISNVTSGVSKMVFGEKGNETDGQEPVSGKTGKGTVDEPYDQGNREGGPTSPTSPTSPSNQGPSAQHPTADGIADPSSGQKPEQKQQGADRPGEDPSESTGTDAAIQATKEEAEQAQNALKNRDPNDHSGEPLKMHDGTEKKEEKKDEGENKEGAKDQPTGTEHVKTSGFEAEGGDFDATKPGAGKEADRLLEAKGVKTTKDEDKTKEGSPAPSSTKEAPSSVSSTPTKRSMSKRIKDKLHLKKKE